MQLILIIMHSHQKDSQTFGSYCFIFKLLPSEAAADQMSGL